MKYLLLLLSTFLFIGCTNKNTEPKQDSTDIAILDLGKGVVLSDFTERKAIESPLTFNGFVPRSWFFEGSFPITLLTLEEDIVVEGYGTGNWLEPVAGSTELNGDDPIAFTSTLIFNTPDSDIGKLRLSQDPTGSDETGIEPEAVETLIIWPAE